MTLIPGKRLLWLVGTLAVAAALAGPLPGLLPVWLLVAGCGLLVALLDLVFSVSRRGRPEISGPSVVRYSKDRPSPLPLVVSHTDGSVRRLRLAIAFPSAFSVEHEQQWIDLPGEGAKARLDWTATPRSRGRFNGLIACAEWKSRWEFWDLRRQQDVRVELRVYPNLFSERRQLAALFLTRGQFGAKLQRTVGRGREFEKLRDYLPGDGLDEIHWKATAKRNRPITKVFQAERTQEIYVVLDISRLSARVVEHEGIRQTALERYLTAALILLLAAERHGDRFGLVTYDDQVRRFLKPGYGDGHFAACREAIYTTQPSPRTPDIAEIVRALRTRITRRALLFVLTDLSDPILAEDFVRHAGLLARQHIVMVNQLRAPETAPLFESGEVVDETELYGKLAGHARWGELQALIRTLKPTGVTATLLEDETMVADLVTQYLAIKQRQAL